MTLRFPVLGTSRNVRAALHSTRTSALSVKTTRVSKHLILNETLVNISGNRKERPLVLLYDWLYAKPSQLRKYSALYHNIGLDVLTIQGRLSHFLWPPIGYRLAEEVLKYVVKTRDDSQRLIIHAFSIGAFNYTQGLSLADRNPELYGGFRERVIGQVFDSIVLGSYDHMTEGIVTLLPNPLLKKGVVPIIDLYYRATSKKTTEEYDRLVALFKQKPIYVPTLFFYSENDPMCHVSTMESMLTNWRRERPHFDVRGKSWEVSQHTAHLKHHPMEYLEEWNSLMTKIL